VPAITVATTNAQISIMEEPSCYYAGFRAGHAWFVLFDAVFDTLATSHSNIKWHVMRDSKELGIKY